MLAFEYQGVHELYLKIQRNAVAFYSWYTDATTKIKSLSTHQGEPSVLGLSQSTQAFFEDERLHQYVDEVVGIAKRMKESTAKAPILCEEDTSSKILLPDVNCNDGTTESMDGLIVDKEAAGAGGSYDNGEPRSDVVVEGQKEPGEQSIEEVGRGGVQPDKSARSIYVPTAAGVHHPFLFHSDRPLSCMVVVPENLGCSIDCGAPDSNQVVLSKLLCENPELFSTVFSLRKEVIDYIFHTSDGTQNM